MNAQTKTIYVVTVPLSEGYEIRGIFSVERDAWDYIKTETGKLEIVEGQMFESLDDITDTVFPNKGR